MRDMSFKYLCASVELVADTVSPHFRRFVVCYLQARLSLTTHWPGQQVLGTVSLTLLKSRLTVIGCAQLT